MEPWDYGQALAAQRMVRSLSDLGVAVTILPSWLPHMLLVDEFVTISKHHREASRPPGGNCRRGLSTFVFCPENILPLAFLDTDVPVCLWTDAPYIAQTDDDYLKYLDRNTGKTCALNELLRQEKEVLAACTLPAFASEWAVSSTQPYRITHAKAVPWVVVSSQPFHCTKSAGRLRRATCGMCISYFSASTGKGNAVTLCGDRQTSE